jgi:myosin heavy subunit
MERDEYIKSLEGLGDDTKSKLIEHYDKEASIKAEVIESRQKSKQKLDEYEKKKAEDEKKSLEEQQKYKELFETADKKVKELEPMVAELGDYKTKYTALENANRKKLIDQLPEGELKEIAGDIKDIEKLEKYVNATVKNLSTPGTNGSRPGGVVIDDKKTWDDYTSQELDDLSKSNRSHYDKLKRAKYPKS